MVSYAYDTIQRRNPAGFFGMVYVLEGTSVNLAHRAAEAIRNNLGLPQTAFRYLTSHGSVDQDHIAFLEKLVNRMEDPADRCEVLHSARMFFHLYGDVFRSVAQ
jgi:heme oxygenase